LVLLLFFVVFVLVCLLLFVFVAVISNTTACSISLILSDIT
jgi:hypothetical protein